MGGSLNFRASQGFVAKYNLDLRLFSVKYLSIYIKLYLGLYVMLFLYQVINLKIKFPCINDHLKNYSEWFFYGYLFISYSLIFIFSYWFSNLYLLPSSVQVKFKFSPIENWDWSYNHCETHPTHPPHPGQVYCKYPGN